LGGAYVDSQWGDQPRHHAGAPGYYSPFTVTSTGSISSNGIGGAICGGTGTVVNQGTLTASGASVSGKYSGVYFRAVARRGATPWRIRAPGLILAPGLTLAIERA
jgi:hypothetical protein